MLRLSSSRRTAATQSEMAHSSSLQCLIWRQTNRFLGALTQTLHLFCRSVRLAFLSLCSPQLKFLLSRCFIQLHKRHKSHFGSVCCFAFFPTAGEPHEAQCSLRNPYVNNNETEMHTAPKNLENERLGHEGHSG